VEDDVVMIEHLERPDGLGPTNGYSHAVIGEGRLVAISGQLPVDREGALVDASDALVQARQVFTNLGRALSAAGAEPRDLLRLTYFLTDLADIGEVRTARDEFLAAVARPASSLVQVAGLVLPGARVEIDALAMIESR
jgi:enamine deaminase RidA (YjgF/YER057c/UK114 family)